VFPQETSPDRRLNTAMGWSSADIGDLCGTTFVVTGANSGLGLETTRQLVAHGARVIAGCRDVERSRKALTLPGPGGVDLREVDLADLSSVRNFAEVVKSDYATVDVLINNAGIMAVPRSLTVDGFERQIGVNHFGHFAMTGQLLTALLAAPNARVVNVSSAAHRMGTMNFDDLHGSKSYSRWAAYGQSKLANLLFTFELQRRFSSAGIEAIAVAAHPGYANTNLQYAHANETGRGYERFLAGLANHALAQSAAGGALPQLYAAVDANVRGGDYIGPSKFFESRGAPKVVQPDPKAHDEIASARLWDESVAATGVTYAALAGSSP
jgi:NAD(P)-dependent dehydrogenase (short-subunit alcohol dehydrogenase family)